MVKAYFQDFETKIKKKLSRGNYCVPYLPPTKNLAKSKSCSFFLLSMPFIMLPLST